MYPLPHLAELPLIDSAMHKPVWDNELRWLASVGMASMRDWKVLY